MLRRNWRVGLAITVVLATAVGFGWQLQGWLTTGSAGLGHFQLATPPAHPRDRAIRLVDWLQKLPPDYICGFVVTVALVAIAQAVCEIIGGWQPGRPARLQTDIEMPILRATVGSLLLAILFVWSSIPS
jgi:hypothetical protein